MTGVPFVYRNDRLSTSECCVWNNLNYLGQVFESQARETLHAHPPNLVAKRGKKAGPEALLRLASGWQGG